MIVASIAFARGVPPMRYHRFWIEIVVLGSAVAFVLALLLATLGAAAGAASGEHDAAQVHPLINPDPQSSFEGMVTCSSCGVKHSAALNRSASNCVRVCVHAGGNFVLIDQDATYVLDGDRDAIKKLAGQRARITGTLHGNVIDVVSALAA